MEQTQKKKYSLKNEEATFEIETSEYDEFYTISTATSPVNGNKSKNITLYYKDDASDMSAYREKIAVFEKTYIKC